MSSIGPLPPRRGRGVRTATALVVASALVLLSSAAGAQSGPLRAGDVVVVSADDRSTPIDGGDVTTEYSLALPDGATCQGDSANDGYRVQSFLVPAADDPGAIVYRSIGPSGPGQIALYDTNTDQYVQALTLMNTEAGQPGTIADPPALTFGVYGPGDVDEGPYLMGLACSLLNQTTRYWSVPVELTRSSSGQILWSVSGSTPSSSSDTNLVTPVVAAVVLAGLLAVGALVLNRRRSSAASPQKELR